MARGPAKRRRKRTHAAAPAAVGERKLLPGERVEVFCCDQGLCGSWHQAVVIGFSENSRTVRYTDFVDENGSGSPLVENVEVSDAIEGKLSVPGEFTRGNIRPLHPHLPLRVSDVSYGLCVDALLEGSYWEGVIVDHMESSIERRVLFPDEGDECKMMVDQLRLTQDWDEVTGKWKLRGRWVFLQMLWSHEEKDGLPVSVRQIWYDLRSKPSFVAEVKMWMCGTKTFWERSLSALMRELWSLCGIPVHEGDQLGDSFILAEASTPAAVQKEKVQPIVPDKLDSTPSVLSQTMSEFISYYRHSDRRSALAKRELVKHHLKSLGWTFVEDKPKNKYYVSPGGKRFPSFIGACEASLALEGTTDSQDNTTNNLDLNGVMCKNVQYCPTGMDLVLRESEANNSASTPWESVQLDAEYSLEVASLLANHQENSTTLLQRRINQTLGIKFKKHLLALGWSIWFKKDEIKKYRCVSLGGKSHYSGRIIRRYRYDSPGGKSYYSTIQVLCSLIDECVKGSHGDRIKSKPGHHNFLATNKDETHSKGSRNISVRGKRKLENQSDAIAEYIDYMGANMQNSGMCQQLRSNAKELLKSAGWKLWLKQKSSNKQESRFCAPHGKSYNSLLAACRGHLQNGYQENSNAVPEITNHGCIYGSMHSSNSIALSDGPRDSGGGYNQLGSVLDRCNGMFTRSTHSSGHGKSKKRKVSPAHMNHAHVLRSRHGQILSCQRRAKTVLSLLVDKNILLPRDKLTYKQSSNGPRIKEGFITGDGIKCLCCKETFTLGNFEVHAGSCTQQPSAHMFLKDGRSLSQCLIQLMGGNRPKGSLQVRLKGQYSHLESDSICSICHDGGEILLCDHCPSAFHHACVGLEATPEGSWYCPSCRCSICESSDYDPDASQFTEKTIMYCDQCEREYHVGCIRNRGHQLSCCPEGCWFCSRVCSKIFQHMQKLIGKPIPTPVEGLSCTILRFSRENVGDHGDYDDEVMAEQHGKLCIALDVLHECFVTIIEPRTQSDLSEDLVFNRESELRRLNFRGFYMILLEKGGELISVGAFRVHGKKFAELPLIGTRVLYRRQGMCRLLMNELEKLLSGLGVERLLLPAVPQLLETWTGSFGFTVMSNYDRLELAENTILSFQGTTMCQKVLNNTLNHPQELKVTVMSNSDRLELAENTVLSFQETTMCQIQKVFNKACNDPEELKGFDYQLEGISICNEIKDRDGQESTSALAEDMEQLEPVLLLGRQSKTGEEGICPSGVPNSLSTSCRPDPQISSVEDKSEQPHISVDADQCKDKCIWADVKPVAPKELADINYKFSGKCYERVNKSASGRNAWIRVSTR